MRLANRHKAKLLYTYLLIGLMGMLTANKIFFLHSHQLDNGTIISHAHPFNRAADSGPLKTHQHTNAASVLYDTLGLDFLTLITTAFFVPKGTPICFAALPANMATIVSQQLHGRSPPCPTMF